MFYSKDAAAWERIYKQFTKTLQEKWSGPGVGQEVKRMRLSWWKGRESGMPSSLRRDKFRNGHRGSTRLVSKRMASLYSLTAWSTSPCSCRTFP